MGWVYRIPAKLGQYLVFNLGLILPCSSLKNILVIHPLGKLPKGSLIVKGLCTNFDFKLIIRGLILGGFIVYVGGSRSKRV